MMFFFPDPAIKIIDVHLPVRIDYEHRLYSKCPLAYATMPIMPADHPQAEKLGGLSSGKRTDITRA